jgi:hypothetical protein
VRRMTEPVEQLGAYCGLAAMVGVLVLGALYLSTRRDLEDLRRRQERADRLPRFLDEAVAAVEEAHLALSELALDLSSAGRSPGARESVAQALLAVKAMRRRVHMHFPPAHPVDVAYGEVEQSLDARASYLIGIAERLGEADTMVEGGYAHDDELRERVEVAVGRFAAAARDEVSTGGIAHSPTVEAR